VEINIGVVATRVDREVSDETENKFSKTENIARPAEVRSTVHVRNVELTTVTS
jgi:hypothetical protein